MNYENFLNSKVIEHKPSGFSIEDSDVNKILYDFQRYCVKWALNKGKAALFEDCGLGKTFQQVEWSRMVSEKTMGNVLIIAPLSVSTQTIEEAKKLDVEIQYINTCKGIQYNKDQGKIYITNYEQLKNIDPSCFSGVSLDESSILKGFTGKVKQQLCDMFEFTPYKLCCTATPSPNDFMELGNHSEFLNIMSRTDMLSMFFVHDGGETQKWRLKGHAQNEFWKWVSSWAIIMDNPATLGFNAKGYELPEKETIEHIVETEKHESEFLFNMEAQTLQERQKARKLSVNKRVEYLANLVKEKGGKWIIWCNLNEESEKITKAINGAIEVSGSHSNEYKSEKMLAFARGEIDVLVTKPKIAGFGMNWQICNQNAFLGLSDSFEAFYQAERRTYRFGQDKKVETHIIVSDTEGSVLKNIKRKELDHKRLMKSMSEITGKHTGQKTMNNYEVEVIEKENHKIFNGDCVECSKEIADNSIDYSIFSPPFSSLYTYSNSERDMGNSKDDAEFEQHFKFLIKELYRIIKPGRLVSFHCMNIPAMKERDGFIGLKDFRGDLIRWFRDEGFVHHSEVVIWKDPLTEATRTKALGLMHKQLCKDSNMCRQGIPDYLITMRKLGDNIDPVSKPNGMTEFHGENEPNGGVYSHEVWRRYASPVWMDINQTNTLQKGSARDEKDERHICPLQLDVIKRGIQLWTNEGETVFSPFMGIGSEGYCSLEMKRKFVGVELKPSYFKQAKKNLENVSQQQELTLF